MIGILPPTPRFNPPNDPDPNSASTSPDAAAKADAKSSEQSPPDTNPLDSGQKADPSNPSDANAASGADSKSGQQSASKDSKDAKDAKDSNQSGNSGDSSSLANKLRDALSNLLAKMKPQSKPGGGKPNDSSQSASSRPSQQGEQQEGSPKSPGQEQADASANSQAEGEQQQGGTEQASQGKSQGRSNNQPNSPDGKSGIGKQDGDKAAREAAELAAMGKLSEIIGKRAANISGEVMVEVSSGKQQLKTQYSQQNAAHAEAGSEINRDEVPLAYQQYVQQYFAQVRKLPAGEEQSRAGFKAWSVAGFEAKSCVFRFAVSAADRSYRRGCSVRGAVPLTAFKQPSKIRTFASGSCPHSLSTSSTPAMASRILFLSSSIVSPCE